MLPYLIIFLAIVSRLIPHWPNVGAITALAIFGAAYLPKKQAIAIPLVARLLSDYFLGFFAWPLMLAVYASHLSGVLFGLWIKKTNSQVRWLKIITSSLGTAFIFFIVTNFAWLYPQYPHTWSGVWQSYLNGLPFLRGTLIGDLGYTMALFSAYALANYTIKQVKLRFKPARL